ncbi:MAG: hypothetical protein GX595_17435 [Lentisphaerae bacterium]|nr:hypothetical protein [Lentisphaerota bacterium]
MPDKVPIPKPGESFLCRACGRESLAKVKKVMDGWRCTGEVVLCAFCQAPVAPATTPAASAASRDSGAANAAALRRLAALLDTEPAAAPRLADATRGHFCKDCRHFLRHPFYSRCLHHEKNVEPMEDCDDFDPRPEGADATSEEPPTTAAP